MTFGNIYKNFHGFGKILKPFPRLIPIYSKNHLPVSDLSSSLYYIHKLEVNTIEKYVRIDSQELSSCTVWHHGIVFLGKTLTLTVCLSTQLYKTGIGEFNVQPCDGLASPFTWE